MMLWLSHINLLYLLFYLLFIGVVSIYFKDTNKKYIKIIIYIVSFIIFLFTHYMWNEIFKMKFLDVKMYLILLVCVNCIMLYTFKHKIPLWLKIINFFLFFTIIFFLAMIISITLGNYIALFYIMDIKNAVNLMDLSFIIFLIYGIIVFSIYIGIYIRKNNITISDIAIWFNSSFDSFIDNFYHFFHKFKRNDDNKMLSDKELLAYPYQEGFFIHGEDCSIIFEDSVPDNIICNYHILYHNIHAKLMNGFTLDENKKLKRICGKLNNNRLTTVDLDYVKEENLVDEEEYQLLKRVVNSYENG